MSRPRIQYVIAYDITDPRRLARVHRCLQSHAFPVQYSVFVATLDRQELNAVLAELGRIIDPRQDDVRAYPLPVSLQIDTVGCGHVIEGLVAPDLSPPPLSADQS